MFPQTAARCARESLSSVLHCPGVLQITETHLQIIIVAATDIAGQGDALAKASIQHQQLASQQARICDCQAAQRVGYVDVNT